MALMDDIFTTEFAPQGLKRGVFEEDLGTGGGTGIPGLNIPGLSLDMGSGRKKKEEAPAEDSSGQDGSTGDGLALDIDFPEFDISGPDVSISGPDLSVTGPEIPATNAQVDFPELGDVSLPPVDFSLPIIDPSLTGLDLPEGMNILDGDMINISGLGSFNLGDLGINALNIGEFDWASLHQAGLNSFDILNGQAATNAGVTAYDGSFGQVRIGNGDLALDIGTDLNNAYENITTDTMLGGVAAGDLWDLATNPTQFVENVGADMAEGVLIGNLGMDAGQAGVLVDILGSGDVGAATQNVAENYAWRATTAAVGRTIDSVLPGVGVVVEFVANLFSYRCVLSTGAYECGLINKKEYLKFTRYRLQVQSKEPMATQVWVGYQIAFDPTYRLMKKNRHFARFIYWLLIRPWGNCVDWKLGARRIPLMSYIQFRTIAGISIVTYYLNYKKSKLIEKIREGVNVMDSYKHTIRAVEGGLC